MVVSVIIPTLGRASLAAAVSSVMMQGTPTEILVVNDSGGHLDRSSLPSDVVVFDTPGRCGAAAARNLGLERASGECIAFLDDDDEWLRGHLDDALHVLASRPDIDIYSCRSLVVDADGHGRIEPAELLQSGTIQDHFFGPGSWYARSRRLPTPTLVFRRRLTAHRHDESLRRREDTWWLLTAEREMGARLFQSPHIGVIVYVDRPRQMGIDESADHFRWAQRLDTIMPGSGATQVISRGRAAARSGSIETFPRLAAELRQLPKGGRRLPILALQGLAGASFRVKRHLRGR